MVNHSCVVNVLGEISVLIKALVSVANRLILLNIRLYFFVPELFSSRYRYSKPKYTFRNLACSEGFAKFHLLLHAIYTEYVYCYNSLALLARYWLLVYVEYFDGRRRTN